MVARIQQAVKKISLIFSLSIETPCQTGHGFFFRERDRVSGGEKIHIYRYIHISARRRKKKKISGSCADGEEEEEEEV